MSPGNGKKRDPDCCSEGGGHQWMVHSYKAQNKTTDKWAGVAFDSDSFHLYFAAMILVCVVLYVVADEPQVKCFLLGSMPYPAPGLDGQHQVNLQPHLRVS